MDKIKTKVFGSGEFEIEITSEEAFRLLCDAMHFDYFHTKDFYDVLIVKDDKNDEAYVYYLVTNKTNLMPHSELIEYNGKQFYLYDDRGNTFIALYNLAYQIFMGLDSLLIANIKDVKRLPRKD